MITIKDVIENTPVFGMPGLNCVVPLSMLKDNIVGVYAIRYYGDYIYIGESKNIKNRCIDHLTQAIKLKTAKQEKLYEYMNRLLLRGSHFEIEILEINFEEIDIEKWDRLDKEGGWIRQMRKDGYDIFNKTHFS